MKKVFMIIMILCTVFSLFAEAPHADGYITVTDIENGAEAWLPITFNNTFCDVTIGFSSTPVTGFTEEISNVTGITLVRNGNTASYGTDAANPLYMYWRILSSADVNLTLKPLTGENNSTGALISGTNPLHWYVASYGNNTEGAPYFNTFVGNAPATIETGHNPEESIGKAGSQQISIRTADLYVAPAGEYKGALVLTISAK